MNSNEVNPMILAGNQPYFLPYLGYFQLINAADVFKISDDYNYINKGWVNRNRILINGQPSYFNLEVEHASSNKLITELNISQIPVEKKMKQLMFAYGRAPFYKEAMAVMEEIYSCPDRNLADFLTNSLKVICRYLDIQTKLIRTSDFAHNSDFRKQYRIFDLAHRIGADTYYNAIGGMEMYSFEEFRREGLQLGFLKMGDIQYPQFGNEFVPSLSILDVMMFNSSEQIQEMLQNYTIIKE